jgi:integrase
LLGFLPFYLQMVLVIGYHYGMRRGEILALRWDQVDWEHAVIRLDRAQTKGKQARVAPLIGEVRAWLERAYLERREGEQTIISYRESDHVRRPGENAGRPRKLGGVFDQAAAWGVTPKTARRILSLNLEGDQLAEAVAAAQKSSASRRGFLDPGAEASRVVPSVARVVPSVAKPRAAGKPIQSIKTAWETARKAAGVPELLVHDLRRTAASNMLRAGLNEKEVMQILGHKTAAMLRRYNIVDERGMVEAARKMERYQAGLAVGGKKPIGGVSTKLVQGSEPVKLRKSGKGVIIQ